MPDDLSQYMEEFKRVNYSIRDDQAINIIEAVQYANIIGKPLNRFITINLSTVYQHDSDVGLMNSKYLRLFKEWVKRKNSGNSTEYVYVRETDRGDNSHVHILAHVPADLVPNLTKMQQKWVKKLSRHKDISCAIRSEPVGRSIHSSEQNFPEYEQNLKAITTYILKGASEITRAKLKIRDVPGKSYFNTANNLNTVIGKRAGVSEGISRKARKDWEGPEDNYLQESILPHYKYSRIQLWEDNGYLPDE